MFLTKRIFYCLKPQKQCLDCSSFFLLTFVTLQVHVHLKRHLMKDLPTTDEDVAQWCKDAFVAKVHHSHLNNVHLRSFPYFPPIKLKSILHSAYESNQDTLLDKHELENSFGEQRTEIGRPVKSLLVYLLHLPYPLPKPTFSF